MRWRDWWGGARRCVGVHLISNRGLGPLGDGFAWKIAAVVYLGEVVVDFFAVGYDDTVDRKVVLFLVQP